MPKGSARPASEVLFCEHYKNIISHTGICPSSTTSGAMCPLGKTTRPFLRTSNFVAGGTQCRDEEDAREESCVLRVYEEFYKRRSRSAVTGKPTRKNLPARSNLHDRADDAQRCAARAARRIRRRFCAFDRLPTGATSCATRTRPRGAYRRG